MSEKESMFRVGGCYRQRNGDLVRLVADPLFVRYYEALAWEVNGDKFHRGARRLSNGEAFPYGTGERSEFDLLPGELHCVDGEWVPVEGAQQCDPGRFCAAEADGNYCLCPAPVDSNADMLVRDTKPAPAKPEGPRFDPFPGFTVTKHAPEQATAASCWTTLGDPFKPEHGSASLL